MRKLDVCILTLIGLVVIMLRVYSVVIDAIMNKIPARVSKKGVTK